MEVPPPRNPIIVFDAVLKIIFVLTLAESCAGLKGPHQIADLIAKPV